MDQSRRGRGRPRRSARAAFRAVPNGQSAPSPPPNTSYQEHMDVNQILPEVPPADFATFMETFLSQPQRTEEESERTSLRLQINKMKLEIENLKVLKTVEELKKNNNKIAIEILKMKCDMLTNEPDPSDVRCEKNATIETTLKKSDNDSINIRNVIYNNCDQNFVIKQSSETRNPQECVEENIITNNDPNFTAAASEILTYFTKRLDANIASQTASVKQYACEVLKKEYNNLKKNENEERQIPTTKIKVEKSDKNNAGKPHAENHSTVQTGAKTPSPVEEPSTSEKQLDSIFSYTIIKPKIIEYLSDKVEKDTVISATRRLTKAKSTSIMKQPFEEHTKLLRVYLFQDTNILVQDMIKCPVEFAKESYRSVRYYAVSLTKSTNVRVIPNSIPEANPGCSSYKQNVGSDLDKMDYVILQPSRDSIMRPRFRVEMIRDMMISEDFELISFSPFIIRPLYTEVVLTSIQIDMLKPLVLKALENRQNCPEDMPVISITSKIKDNIVQKEMPREANDTSSNLFLITQKQTNSSEQSKNYDLQMIKPLEKVIDLTDKTTASLKRVMEPCNQEVEQKKTKGSEAPKVPAANIEPLSNKKKPCSFSTVNGDADFNDTIKNKDIKQEILNIIRPPDHQPKQYQIEETNQSCYAPTEPQKKDDTPCINLDDDDDDTIVIN